MFIEALKAFLIGLTEGITEWLPISSTGHMILVDEFMSLQVSPAFMEFFLVVIQLGAILAVVILYFSKLNPFSRVKSRKERKGTWRLWGMVVIGCIPAAVIGIAFDDWFHDNFYGAVTVALALIVYGIAFIVIECAHKKKQGAARAGAARVGAPRAGAAQTGMPRTGAPQTLRGKHARVAAAPALPYKIEQVEDIDVKTALKIGAFQVLAIIPGTSRSGSTILGGLLAGCSRVAASEFSFFLAIPVMFGWGLLKTVKYLTDTGFSLSSIEAMVLGVGMVVAFVVSILSIKFLVGFVKKHSFIAFGIYRILIGVIVLVFFVATGQVFG